MLSKIEKFPFLGDDCYIKREDLIGGLFNGVKQRKLHALMAYLTKTRPSKVYLKGSLQSNFLLAIVPRLIEHRIPFEVYTYPSYHHRLTGNSFFLSFFIDIDAIKPLHQLPPCRPDEMIIEEGGDQLEGYLGLIDLGEEIISQNNALNLQLQHVWIDAGTGATAACLDYVFTRDGAPFYLHVVSMKENEHGYKKKKQQIFDQLNKHFQTSVSPSAPFQFYRPPSARAFGSINRSTMDLIKTVARFSGILLDPIYTAKLVMTMQTVQHQQPTLFIHSGGTLAMSALAELQPVTKPSAAPVDPNSYLHNHTSTAGRDK